MPQVQYTEEEKQALRALGVEPDEKKPAPVSAAPPAPEESFSTRFLKGMRQSIPSGPELVGAASGAVGGIKSGGTAGSLLGALVGYGGAKMSPETWKEQAAANLATSPFSNAARLLPILGRMLAGGAAAGVTSYADKGNAKEALATGAGSAAGEVLSPLSSLVPGLGRKGALKETVTRLEKVSDEIGPTGTLLGKAKDSLESTLKRISLAASNTGAVPELERIVDNTLFKGGNISKVTSKIFNDPKRVRELVATASPADTERLVGQYIQEAIIDAPRIRSKPGVIAEALSPVEKKLRSALGLTQPTDNWIFDGKAATESIKQVVEGGAFDALPAAAQQKLKNVLDIVSAIDPSEALKTEERLGNLTSKILVSGATRGGGGQRNVVVGTGTGLLANQLRKITNPEVKEIIRRASTGEMEAVQNLFRVLGITASNKLTSGSDQYTEGYGQ